MNKISEKKNGGLIRKLYEPLYGKRLSDEEVEEIEANLKAFAEVILKIAGQLKNKSSQYPS